MTKGRTFTISYKAPVDISAKDLATEIASLTDGQTALETGCITIYVGGKPVRKQAEYLWLPIDRQLGIGWGKDTYWEETTSLERGIELWLEENELDKWNATN